jgi:hypothetical protein
VNGSVSALFQFAEGCGGLLEPERHTQRLEQTRRGLKMVPSSITVAGANVQATDREMPAREKRAHLQFPRQRDRGYERVLSVAYVQ